MNRVRRYAIVACLSTALAVPAVVPAFAQDTDPAAEQTPSGAAVELEEEAPEAEAAPWTSRFMIPTMVAITAVVVVGAFIGYGLRVRARYRVVR